MLRAVLGWIGIALLGACTYQTALLQPSSPGLPAVSFQPAKLQSSSPAPGPTSAYREVLDRYCVTCHNESLRTAGLLLDQADVEKVSESAELWGKVVQKLRARAMPPAGMPRPNLATYDSFATYLETELGGAVAANLSPDSSPDTSPRRQLIHRLNRAEYTNAIRDLLEVEFDAASYLPADDSGEGFDNLAALLSVSPVLMERYMFAAGKISRLATGNASSRQTIDFYDISEGVAQDSRLSDDLPFGSRGGIAVRHHFPLDGEYLLTIQLQRNGD